MKETIKDIVWCILVFVYNTLHAYDDIIFDAVKGLKKMSDNIHNE